MDGDAVRALCAEAGKVPDPRVVPRCDHLLVDIVAITILAVICGADDWLSVQAFAVERQGRLKQFLKLPAGVPSHDTFGRVMGLIEPKQFTACLINWMSALQTALKGRVVAIDGKTARGSGRKQKGLRPIHIVSAWAIENGVMLGQLAVDEKSNEITAIPELPPQATRLSKVTRQHWGIENTLHWSMDVTFREDHHRLQDRNGVQNLSAIRRMAVSILRQDKSSKVGAKTKRMKAALNPNYLLQVLNNAVF